MTIHSISPYPLKNRIFVTTLTEPTGQVVLKKQYIISSRQDFLREGKNRIIKSNISCSFMKYLLPKFQNLYFFPSKPNVQSLTHCSFFSFLTRSFLSVMKSTMNAFLFFSPACFCLVLTESKILENL